MAFSILFYGCEDREVLMSSYEDSSSVEGSSVFKISQHEALAISDGFRRSYGSRSSVFALENVEYVTESHTRSGAPVDTVAYIFNYRDSGGFTIVSADNRVSPILAYSDTGYFTNENEIAKEAFCDRIGDYLRKVISKGDVNGSTEGDLESCAAVMPIVKGSMSQRAPFNKYVVPEHPTLGSLPVGCVAVACATVMIHSANSLKYHNSVFKLKSIREGFISQSQTTRSTNTKQIVGVDSPYSYDRAVDSIAKLLYWIGKDVGMNYGSKVSYAATGNARLLLDQLGFNPSNMISYNDVTVAMYLVDGYIVNVKGSGHSWIIDGCQYCIFSGRIIKPVMHCDWGWGGYCNGYYEGSVFETQGNDYSPTEYYAVKMTNNILH